MVLIFCGLIAERDVKPVIGLTLRGASMTGSSFILSSRFGSTGVVTMGNVLVLELELELALAVLLGLTEDLFLCPLLLRRLENDNGFFSLEATFFMDLLVTLKLLLRLLLAPLTLLLRFLLCLRLLRPLRRREKEKPFFSFPSTFLARFICLALAIAESFVAADARAFTLSSTFLILSVCFIFASAEVRRCAFSVKALAFCIFFILAYRRTRNFVR